MVYDVPNPAVDDAVACLKGLFKTGPKDNAIITRARAKRVYRTEIINEASQTAVSAMPVPSPLSNNSIRFGIFWKSGNHHVHTGDTPFMLYGVFGHLHVETLR